MIFELRYLAAMLVAARLTLAACFAQDTPPVAAGLSVQIQFDPAVTEPTIAYDRPVRVVLSNESDKPLRVWNPQLKPGYGQITFHFTDPKTGKVKVARRRQIDDDGYWKAIAQRYRRAQETIEIAAQGEQAFEFVLDEFAWGERAWVGMPSPNRNEPYTVWVQFASADGSQKGVWTGSVQSERKAAHFVAPHLQTPHQYLWDGFAEKAIELMEADPKLVNSRDKERCTPLHHAARFGPPAVVAWLLEHGADVNAAAYNNFRPLHLTKDPGIVRLILEKKPDLTSENSQGETLLQNAALHLVDDRATVAERDGWRQIVKLYTEALGGADLRTAIILGDLERVQTILTNSPKLADDFQGGSPLRTAVAHGHFEICKYLLDSYRIDVNDFKRGVGYPIIKVALPHPKIVRLLIEHGADLKTRITWQGGRTGRWFIGNNATALHFAAKDGVPETIKLLIEHGVDIHATAHEPFGDTDKQTALEVAAHYGKAENALAIIGHPKFDVAEPEQKQAVLDKCLWLGAAPDWLDRDVDRPKLMEVLLKKGANPNTSERGRTPLLRAAVSIRPSADDDNRQSKEIIAMLRRHGAKPDLFSAVSIGDEPLVQALLAGDGKLANVRGPDGVPALHVAVKMNYPNIVKVLLKAGGDVNIGNESENTGDVGETPLDWADFWARDEIAKLLVEAGGKCAGK